MPAPVDLVAVSSSDGECPQQPSETPEHVDVLIVGAGVSGIGCAYHLQSAQPSRSYLILEGRDAIGGTWDLFRYPGIRSDSDLHTFGYAFKPWRNEKAIADGPAIRSYICETAAENGIDSHIRFGHTVIGASWSSAEARWCVRAVQRQTGESVEISCSWLFCAGGYYRYDEGYTPAFDGVTRFEGQIIHPQHWPESLDYAGKRVVVIGSGATAVTLIPALAEQAAHVTMLQRSPTYVVSVPEKDPIANLFKRLLPAGAAYALARRKNIWLQKTVYSLSQSRPKLVRRLVRAGVKRQLPADFPVDIHFNPRYNPWTQRLCAVPDGDLFKAIAGGRASVVTDTIETFTERGIELGSGAEIEADIVVTATGLNLLAFGGIELSVDEHEIDLAQTMAFKAMLLSDVPNFAFAIGYTNSSWTLKVDLVCEYFARLLGYMDEHGYDTCVAHNDDPTIDTRPLLDFGAGYVQRSVHKLPKQGTRFPWSMAMSYAQDVKTLRNGPIEDPALGFSHRALVPDTSSSAVLSA